jgi:hypothetical protein
MNKKTQMYLGGAVLLAAAYYFWNKSQSEKKNAAGPRKPLVFGDSQYDMMGNRFYRPR